MAGVVLDSEGLSRAVRYDKKVVLPMLTAAWEADIPVVVCAATLVEVIHNRIDRPRLQWLLSRLIVEPVTDALAWRASDLLLAAERHGHKYAIDAMVAATALSLPGQVAVLTSDVDDMTRLLADHGRVRILEL